MSDRRPLRRTATALALVFLAVFVARREVIALPPYWDQAYGLWNEADFLATTRFDYRRLVLEEPSVREGGARCYVYSLVSPAIAAAMLALPSPRAVFVLGHLLTFAAAAVVIWLSYLAARAGLSRGAAALVAVAVATTPLMVVQTDMLGLELPLAAIALLCLRAVERGAFYTAIGWTVVALLVKPTGFVLTVALAITLALVAVATTEPRARRARRRVLIAALGVTAIQAVLIVTHPNVAFISGGEQTSAYALGNLRFLAPDVLLLAAIAMVVAALLVGGRLFDPQGAGAGSGWLAQVRAVVVEQAAVIMAAGFLCGIALGFVGTYCFPRYLAIAVPVVYWLLARGLAHAPRVVARAGLAALALVVVLNVVNRHGRLYPRLEAALASSFAELPDPHPRSYGFLERSLEYLEDQRAALAAVDVLAGQPAGTPLLVGHPFDLALSKPRLGYVKQARPTPDRSDTASVLPAYVEGIQAASNGHAPAPVMLVFGQTRAVFPPVRPGGDKELFRHEQNGEALIIYRLSTDHYDSSVDLKRWFLQRTAYGPWPTFRAATRAGYFLGAMRPELARPEIENALKSDPGNGELRGLLDEVGRQEAMLAAAARRFPDAATLDPRLAWIDSQLWEGRALELPSEMNLGFLKGFQLAQSGQLDEADRQLELLQDVWRWGSTGGTTLVARGLIAAADGRWDDAIALYRRAVERHPEEHDQRLALGYALLATGDLAGAEAALAELTARWPESAEAFYWLGVTQQRQGRTADAVKSFAAAAQVCPDWDAPRQALAKLSKLESK